MAALQRGKKAGNRVFAGLKRIEYRGYDSWGVAVVHRGEITLKKKVGKLSETKTESFVSGPVALGHTRWATHGGVTQVNAHPHLAQSGLFALVQNGVVENYQELRDDLLDSGYQFVSETDTEVIVGLLERELEARGLKQVTKEAVAAIFAKLEGRNTIGVITQAGDMFAVRNGSPLVVGKNAKSGEVFFSSDVVSLATDATEYAIVKSGQMVTFIDSKVALYDVASLKKLKIEYSKITLTQESVSTGKFSTHMEKEIHEQAEKLHLVLKGKEKQFIKAKKAILQADLVFVLGAGTASFAAKHIASLFRSSGLVAYDIPSYEADSFHEIATKKSVCIALSQSGETADTNEVIEWMKQKGVTIISEVNMPGSSLTQMSNIPFMLDVGPELAVASTKAFFGQMLWGMAIHSLICDVKYNDIYKKTKEFEHELLKWFADSRIQKKIRSLANTLATKSHVFILGRGDLYISSLESALKLKEISYVHAEGFSGGELKHGVIALIEQGTPVLCLVAEDENKANMHNAIAEINARGGYSIVVAFEDNELYKEWIEVPELSAQQMNFMSLMTIVPSQLLTCYMAQANGHNVDKPRNLAKSVTVK